MALGPERTCEEVRMTGHQDLEFAPHSPLISPGSEARRTIPTPHLEQTITVAVPIHEHPRRAVAADVDDERLRFEAPRSAERQSEGLAPSRCHLCIINQVVVGAPPDRTPNVVRSGGEVKGALKGRRGIEWPGRARAPGRRHPRPLGMINHPPEPDGLRPHHRAARTAPAGPDLVDRRPPRA